MSDTELDPVIHAQARLRVVSALSVLGDGDRITFQQGGRLWAVDLPSERLHELRVSVSDDGARTRPHMADVSGELRETDVTGAVDVRLTPSGDAFGGSMAEVVREGTRFLSPQDREAMAIYLPILTMC